MKISIFDIKLSINRVLQIFLLLIFSTLLRAETLVIPSGQGSQLTFAAGEVAIVSYYQASLGPAPYLTYIVTKGVTNVFPLAQPFSAANASVALPGPVTLIFDSSCSHIISYKKLISNTIHSQIISFGHTNIICVPNGKTIRFLSVTPEPAYEISVSGQIRSGTNVFVPFSCHRGMELSGPLDIVLSVSNSTPGNGTLEMAAVYSYYILEDFLLMPDTGLLQGPTGSFELNVQKSVDLTNWFPVIVQSTSDDQKAFYRLSLSR